MPIHPYYCPECGSKFEILASGKPPETTECEVCQSDGAQKQFPDRFVLKTDTELMNHQGTLLQQFDGNEAEVARVMRAAKKQGCTPGYNDVYVPTLADSCGDPKAFIKPADQTAEVRRLCAARGVGCEGPVTVKGPEPGSRPRTRKPLGEDIIEERIRRITDKDPDKIRHRKRLREEVIEKHSYKGE